MKFLSPTEIRARALEDAADSFNYLDHIQGTDPRAMQAFDRACEDPAEWLRNYADRMRKDWEEFRGETK